MSLVIVAPLYALLQKGSKWKWRVQQEKAFSAIQSQLTSGCLFVFTEVTHISLRCFPYGMYMGAVLPHSLIDGSEQPIAFTHDLSRERVSYGYCNWYHNISWLLV